jgi:hypothetical protein
MTTKSFASARGALVAAGLILAPAAGAQAQTLQLVTAAEAALPPGAAPSLEFRGSPTRRPSIQVVSPPAAAGVMHSPLELKLRFHAFGGAAIDPETVVVTYLKTPAIDVTQRLAPYITADGIAIDHAELPAGDHQFWIELKDKSGRVGTAEFTVQVAQ